MRNTSVREEGHQRRRGQVKCSWLRAPARAGQLGKVGLQKKLLMGSGAEMVRRIPSQFWSHKSGDAEIERRGGKWGSEEIFR